MDNTGQGVDSVIALEEICDKNGKTQKIIVAKKLIKTVRPIYAQVSSLIQVSEPAPGKAAINLLDGTEIYVNHSVVEIADALDAKWIGNDRDKKEEEGSKIEIPVGNVVPIVTP